MRYIPKTIYKYQFTTTDQIMIPMPEGATLLAVQMQKGTPCLWALVHTAARTVTRVLRVHGTGHPVAHSGAYVGTYQEDEGALILHVFDLGEIS